MNLMYNARCKYYLMIFKKEDPMRILRFCWPQYLFVSFMFALLAIVSSSVFGAAEPMAQPLKQDLNAIVAVPAAQFFDLIRDLRAKVSATLDVKLEQKGSRTAPYLVEVIKGIDGSESSFKTTHQVLVKGEWKSQENEPHITLKVVPNQFLAYLDRQLTGAACRDLKIPQLRVSGFNVFRGLNQPDRAYIVARIEPCDPENDFETLAAQIDSLLPDVPRNFEFKSHITLATIIPLSQGRGLGKSVISDCAIEHWKQQLDTLWNQLCQKNKNVSATCYGIDHLKISYWVPGSSKEAEAHGITMATYVPKTDRMLCRAEVPTRVQRPQFQAQEKYQPAQPISAKSDTVYSYVAGMPTYLSNDYKDEQHRFWFKRAWDSSVTNIYEHYKQIRKAVNSDDRYSLMKEIVKAKFEDNNDFRAMLLATGNAKIINNSDHPEWGVGSDGKGQNLLGKILEEVRREFHEQK